MSTEVEIMTTISREFTLKDFNKTFNKINETILNNKYEANFIDCIIENDVQLEENMPIGISNSFFEFRGDFEKPFFIWKNDEPHDDLYPAEETVVSEAKFDKETAIKLAKKIQEINVSFKIKWRHEKERLKGLVFILCLCELFEGILFNIETGFPFVGAFTIDQVREFVVKELNTKIQ